MPSLHIDEDQCTVGTRASKSTRRTHNGIHTQSLFRLWHGMCLLLCDENFRSPTNIPKHGVSGYSPK